MEKTMVKISEKKKIVEAGRLMGRRGGLQARVEEEKKQVGPLQV